MKQYSRYLEPGGHHRQRRCRHRCRLRPRHREARAGRDEPQVDGSERRLRPVPLQPASATSAVYRTTDSLDAATQSNVAITSSTLNVQLPAKSITTYVIDGASNANQPTAIVSSLSGKCASVRGWSTTNGAAIEQWTCGTGSANQLWVLDSAPGQRASLRSSHSGKCVSVADWSTSNGAALVQWDCGGASTTNQLWELGDPEVLEPALLVSELSGKCASVSNWSTTDGAALVQWTCNDDSANQRWRLE